MWWAHPGFTRMNIKLTILTNGIEEQPDFWALCDCLAVFERYESSIRQATVSAGRSKICGIYRPGQQRVLRRRAIDAVRN